MKKHYLLTALLAGILPALGGTAVSAAETNAMSECVQYGQPFEIDLETVGIRLPYFGYYYGEVDVNGSTREYREYLPEDTLFNSYQLVLAVPDEVDVDSYLLDSGWKALADENKFSIFILMPENGTWGAIEQELAYVEAAYERRTNATNAACAYVAGFDKGGAALQEYVMKNSLSTASAVFVNASGDITEDYLAELKESVYQANESDQMIKCSDVPVPVWIIDKEDGAESVISYWKEVNETVDEAEVFAENASIWRQDAAKAAVNHFTPCGPVADVVVSAYDPEVVLTEEFTRMVYDSFLSLTNRYGSTAWSNEVYPRLDLAEEDGLKEYEFVNQGVLRQYSVYVPEGYDPSQAYPVVYTLPGGDQTHKMHMEISRWNDVADEYGYIVVSVSGATGLDHMKAFGQENAKITGESLTKYLAFNDTGDNEKEGYINDVEFFQELISRVEAEYLVDESRRYLSAHSNGAEFAGNMVTQIGQYFAGIARYSGNIPANMGDCDVPFYPVIGQNNGEVMNWFTGVMAGADDPQPKTFAGKFKAYLTGFWGYSEEEADAIMAAPAISAEETEVGNGLLYKTWEWQTQSGFPIIRTTTTSYRGHSFVVSDTRLQAEWFTHWARVNGEIQYNGETR